MYNKSFRPRRSPHQSFARSPHKRRFAGAHIDIEKFITKAAVTSETETFVPQHRFADFAVHPTLKTNILAKGYETPTAIQDQTIPLSLEGKDVIGVS